MLERIVKTIRFIMIIYLLLKFNCNVNVKFYSDKGEGSYTVEATLNLKKIGAPTIGAISIDLRNYNIYIFYLMGCVANIK